MRYQRQLFLTITRAPLEMTIKIPPLPDQSHRMLDTCQSPCTQCIDPTLGRWRRHPTLSMLRIFRYRRSLHT